MFYVIMACIIAFPIIWGIQDIFERIKALEVEVFELKWRKKDLSPTEQEIQSTVSTYKMCED